MLGAMNSELNFPQLGSTVWVRLTPGKDEFRMAHVAGVALDDEYGNGPQWWELSDGICRRYSMAEEGGAWKRELPKPTPAPEFDWRGGYLEQAKTIKRLQEALHEEMHLKDTAQEAREIEATPSCAIHEVLRNYPQSGPVPLSDEERAELSLLRNATKGRYPNLFVDARKTMAYAFATDPGLSLAYEANVAMLLADRYGICKYEERNQAAKDILKLIFEG